MARRLPSCEQTFRALGHASRNTMQRAHASLSLLRLELAEHPLAPELLADIAQALEELQQLYQEAARYAAPIDVSAARVVDLPALLERAWSDTVAGTEARNRGAFLVLPPRGRARCLGVAPYLAEAFRHVFHNALETQPSGVHVTAALHDCEVAGESGVGVRIADNGPGFSPAARERGGDLFWTTKPGHLGCGLAFARKLVAAHGGEIELLDREGGAAVDIRLPRPVA